MAIAFINGKTAGSSDSNSVTAAAYDATGATLFASGVSDYSVAGQAVVTDSQSNSPYVALTATASADVRCGLKYFVSPSVSASLAATAALSGSYPGFGHAAFSGVSVSSPFDQQNGVGSASTQESIAPGSVTPTTDGQLLVTAIAFYGAGNISNVAINSGFTIIDAVIQLVGGQHFGFAFAYFIQGAAAAVDPTWSWTTAAQVACRIATFKAATASANTGLGPRLSHLRKLRVREA